MTEYRMQLTCGERMPEFILPADQGMTDTFYSRHCGRPVILIAAGQVEQLTPFAALKEECDLFALLSGSGTGTVRGPVPAMYDDGDLSRMVGLTNDTAPVAWVLDATLRATRRIDRATVAGVRAALDTVRQPATANPPIVSEALAPVLIVPDVLEPELCARLIAAHRADNCESGMIRLANGRPTLVPDERAKQRRDHRLTHAELVSTVQAALERRVLPEIAAAFNYPVTHLEGFKVVAYDARTGGYFRLHRDNITPDAFHRRFALTINLDADYDGGYLRFPEYGDTGYRPAAGGAIVFSGSLLHEVTDVTRGRRHALLTFMWGDEAVAP